MAASDIPRYGDLCRLCATKIDVGNGIHIFHEQGVGTEVKKTIEICLPVQVLELDGLPKMICHDCMYKLDLIVDFRNTTVSAQSYLVSLYKQLQGLQQKTFGSIDPSLDLALDQPEMIMVQPQLINEHIQNVSDLQLMELNKCDNLVVEQEIILPQNTADIQQELSSFNLGQNIRNEHLSSDIFVTEASNVSNLQAGHYTNTNIIMEPNHGLSASQFDMAHDMDLQGSQESHLLATNLQQDSNSLNSNASNESTESNTEFKYSLNDGDLKVHFSLKVDGTELHDFSDSKDMYILQQNENGTENYLCNICGTSHDSKELFDKHYEKHFHKCRICFGLFSSSFTLAMHHKEEHGIVIPDEGVPDKAEQESESDNELGEDADNPEAEDMPNTGKRKKWSPKVCKECGKSFKTNYKLMEHMRRHTGERPFKCSTCEKDFRSKIGLAQHEATHTGKYEFACQTCGKGFQCRSYLIVHQRVHSDVKPYPCTTCGQNFKTKQSLLDHTNRHLGVKPYMCETCGRGFITKGLCRAHQKTHTGVDNRKYSCEVCDKMFVSKSYLQTHIRIHTGEKPFVCDICGKGFLTRVDLKIHNTVHTGEKRFVCEMCGKAFARRDALRCHRRSHTGERPYRCDLCGQTFTQFSPMAIHKRLHTGERPYVCEVCGKKFVSKSTMMAHLKKHSQPVKKE